MTVARQADLIRKPRMERYGLAGGLIKDGVCSCKISKPCVFGDLKAGQTFSADERALMIAMREESHTSQLDSEGTEAEGGGRCRRYEGCFLQRGGFMLAADLC